MNDNDNYVNTGFFFKLMLLTEYSNLFIEHEKVRKI